MLSDAIRKQHTVADETEVLWQADKQSAGGWREGHSYRFHLVHRPKVIWPISSTFFTFLTQIGLIRLKLWEGARLIADSGNIIGKWNLLSSDVFLISCIFKDDGPGSLKGGRLGVYCDSQVTKNWKSI